MSQPQEDLARRIAEAKAREQAGRARPALLFSADGGGGRAFAAAIDLTAAIGVGTFLGYWIDRWLGTHPWGMIMLMFLGFGAGLANIQRSQAGEDFKVGYKDDKKTDKE